jgi:hypothetical protein
MTKLILNQDVQIKTADHPPLTRGFVVFIFSLLWGGLSVAIFVVTDDDLIAVSLASIGIPIWLYLLRRQGKIEKLLSEQHSKYIHAKSGFCCQDCSVEIQKPIKNQNKDKDPILYYCPNCNILWFVGSVDHSTA